MPEVTLLGPGGATEAKQDAELTALALIARETTQSAFATLNHTDLLAILTRLGQTLNVNTGLTTQTNALTRAQLDAALVGISGTVALDAPTLAALELVGIKGADAATIVGAVNRLPVGDDYDRDIITPDQTGAGAVLTFTLGAAAPFVTVDVDPSNPADTANYICRVTLNGATPTASLGHRARGGQTTYLPFPTTGTVKVFAPVGVFVSVQAGAR